MRGFLFGCWLLQGYGAVTVAAVDYEREIKPLLKERCYACHGALKQKAGLRVDTVAGMRQGGEEGDVLAGERALLLARVMTTDLDERMPPEGEGAAFTSEQVALLQRWLAEGGQGPELEKPEPDPRLHWAYHRPQAAAGSLDDLLGVLRQQRGVTEQGPAAPGIWLRRVHLDLTGLPPTVEEVRAFAAAMASAADPKAVRAAVVERLLASPQYGERWARHFMDVWRYSDWYGLGAQMRYSHKHLWHWRDWLVESLNADKGYDEMVRQMLAADEMPPGDRPDLRATGFLARSYYLFNRTTWLDATIEHTSRAFLGLTMQCAKCHDHKYDPVDHAEYYQMRAIFEPMHVRLDAQPGVTDFEKDGLPRVFDLHVERPTYRHVRGDEANVDESKAYAPGVPAVLSWEAFEVEPVKLPFTEHRPGAREQVLGDHLAEAKVERAAAEGELAKAREQVLRVVEAQETTGAAEAPRVLWADAFGEEKKEGYQVIAGTWQWREGQLVQTETGSSRRALELVTLPPTDFVATLRFVIEGGERWKSVGLAFDGVGEEDTLVYVSAAAGGSKVQVSPREGGKSVYPAGAAKARAVMTGKEYELEVRVRGRRIQVLLDGESQVVFELGPRRAGGKLRLTAFDAAAAFTRLEVRELGADESVGEGEQAGALTLAEANQAVEQAEWQARAADWKVRWVQAVHAAEAAPEDAALARAAGKIEAEYDVAAAQIAVRKAQQMTVKAGADAKQKAAVEKQKKETAAALAKAQERLAVPDAVYRPLRAVLKAQEGPDDAANATVQRFPETSTGRRLAFARWVTDRRHPLTARVLVNQVWLRHFGASLVEDVTDFGRRTQPPVQQAVLDTLAVRFMESGWSLKALHREMVLSDLYAMTTSQAGADAATLAVDPDNLLYWRMNARRMESQVVRDSLLHLAGQLDLTMGGATVDPVKNETATRRALYFNQTAFEQHRFLGGFDNANVLECYRREVSVMPQQALALSNSRESAECAGQLSQRYAELPDAALVEEAFWLVLGRPPSAAEQAVCEEALKEMNRDLFWQGLLNHNDFITVR
jgi:hypothetical protein